MGISDKDRLISLTAEEDESCELGYWLGFEYWGQGYATESVRGLLNYAKSNTPCEKFKANVFKENVASAKVLEKNGFKRVEDREVFSISLQENVPSVNYEYR